MTPIIVITTIGILLEVVLVYFARKNGKMARLIRETPTSKIAELKEGLVEVKGHVRPLSEPLESPLSKRSCVYYQFKVQERRRRHTGKSTSHYWVTVINDEQSVPCLVEDETGAAEVALLEANLVLDTDTRMRSGFFNDASPELEQTLNQRYGRSSRGFIFNRTMRYTETVLEERDPLYVLGTAEIQSGRRPRLNKSEGILIVSDKGEHTLQSRYTSFAIACWVGAVFVLGIAGFILWNMLE